MSDEPSEVLRPNLFRTLVIAGVLAVIAAGFAWFALHADAAAGSQRGPFWLLLGAIFFGVGAISVVANLVPGATELRLSSAGVESRKFFRGTLFPWSALGPFLVARIGSARHVVFDLSAEHAPAGSVRAVNAAVVGKNAFLDFDFDPEKLCERLNAWRERSLGARITDYP